MNERAAAMALEDSRAFRFGPKKLNLLIGEGVSRLNIYTLLFGSFFGIAMMGFVNACQPYLFTEVLNIPTDEQGPLAGNLTFLSEIVVICTQATMGRRVSDFCHRLFSLPDCHQCQ
jgi:hypothetical protein